MDRRRFLSALAAVPLAGLLVAACGDPAQQASSSSDPATTTTMSTTTTTVSDTIAHPTGAGDVILRVSYEGGLVPADYFFTSLPAVLLGGDGRLYTQGAVPAVFPGPLLPSIMVAQLDESQVQAILRVVADAGLLAAPPDYSGGSNVADAPNTVLTVTAGGSTYEHSAYALGIGDPETPARAKLLDVVNRVTELSTSEAAGATPFAADWYRLRATATDPTQVGTQDPQPSVVDWPGLRVSLAAADDCTRVSATDAGTLFTEAKQNTYFRDGGVVYQVAVRGVLPGDPAC